MSNNRAFLLYILSLVSLHGPILRAGARQWFNTASSCKKPWLTTKNFVDKWNYVFFWIMNCSRNNREVDSMSHSKKRINLPHFAFSRGCILIADIYTPLHTLTSQREKKTQTQRECGHFSMDVINPPPLLKNGGKMESNLKGDDWIVSNWPTWPFVMICKT